MRKAVRAPEEGEEEANRGKDEFLERCCHEAAPAHSTKFWVGPRGPLKSTRPKSREASR